MYNKDGYFFWTFMIQLTKKYEITLLPIIICKIVIIKKVILNHFFIASCLGKAKGLWLFLVEYFPMIITFSSFFLHCHGK